MLYYYIIINILTYIVFALDKYKATHHQYRISEKILLFLCIIGDAFGGFASMYSFNHKIRKNLFRFPVPILAVLQISLLYSLIK